MSVSQHPVALALERRVGTGTRLLGTVMALPLLDGLFPALVLAGAVDDAAGVLEVGLLVFGGSATMAVVLAEMDGERGETVGAALAVGAAIVALAAVEAALAPVVGQLVDLATFERFAALVVLAVAARTASARIGALIPRPAVVAVLGLVASVDPASVGHVLATGPPSAADPALVLRGSLAAAVGAAFAVGVAALAPWLRDAVDHDRFRFGSAVALGVLSLSLLGVLPSDAPIALAVFGVAALLALDPDGRLERFASDRGPSSASSVVRVAADGTGSSDRPADRADGRPSTGERDAVGVADAVATDAGSGGSSGEPGGSGTAADRARR